MRILCGSQSEEEGGVRKEGDRADRRPHKRRLRRQRCRREREGVPRAYTKEREIEGHTELSRTLAVFNESLVCMPTMLSTIRTTKKSVHRKLSRLFFFFGMMMTGASGVGPDTRQYLSASWTQVRRVI